MAEVKQMVFRIPPELHRRVKLKAARLDLTVSQVLRRFLREWVEEDGDDSDTAA